VPEVSTKKTQRDWLNEYGKAVRDIEVSEAAITMLEACSHRAARVAAAALKTGQQVCLRRLDAAAAKLGAPYQGSTGGR
jgi:hypothetical protein